MQIANQIESFDRERRVEKMILAGSQTAEILQFVSTEYDITERQAYNYYNRALERIRKAADIDRPLEVTRANERFHRIYRETMRTRTAKKPIKVQRFSEEGKRMDDDVVVFDIEIPPNHFAAIAAEKARAELLGLNAPKKIEASINHTVTGVRLADIAEQAKDNPAIIGEMERDVASGRRLIRGNMLILNAEFEEIEEQKEYNSSDEVSEKDG